MKLIRYFALLVALPVILVGCGTSYIGYTYKPLAAEGCGVEYSVQKRDGILYLNVKVSSDRFQFTANPEMMLRNFNDETISLYGSFLGYGPSSYGVVVGNVVVSDNKAEAEFVVPREYISFFKSGIKKLRMTMTPMNHERKFNRDVIGVPLYRRLLQEIKRDDLF